MGEYHRKGNIFYHDQAQLSNANTTYNETIIVVCERQTLRYLGPESAYLQPKDASVILY